MTAGIEEDAPTDAELSMRGRLREFLFSNPYFLLTFASLCWSGNHIVGRAIAGHVPPIGISTVRWLIPAVVLWPIVRPHMDHDWPLIRRHWRVMIGLGLTGGALFSTLQYVGLQYTTALNVSVLNSLTPVLIVAAGSLIFRDRLMLLQGLGIATSLAGVLAIVAHGNFEALAQLELNRGDLIIVFNMTVIAIYAACLRLRPQIHALTFLFVLAVVSVVGTTPFFVWEHLSGFTFQPTLMTGLAIFYVSIFPSALAFAAWNRAIEIIGANRAGPFLHLVPLFSALLAGTFLGESLMLYHVAGFMLILAGVWLASRRHGSRPMPMRRTSI